MAGFGEVGEAVDGRLQPVGCTRRPVAHVAAEIVATAWIFPRNSTTSAKASGDPPRHLYSHPPRVARPLRESWISIIIHEILAACRTAPSRLTVSTVARPQWFAAFLADRGTRKPSAHTLKAYRQDFDAIATLIVGGGEDLSGMALAAVTVETMRTAFAQYGP